MFRTLGLNAGRGASLAACIEFGKERGWDVVTKDTEALAQVSGMRLAEMSQEQRDRFVKYCSDDGRNCYTIFENLLGYQHERKSRGTHTQ